MAINAVFDSWNTDRARLYRRRERIPQDLGTAVNICTMVFGNLGETSGTGVAFTRDPASGKIGAYGDYLPNAQGEDVVAGIRNTLSLDDLRALDPASHKQLTKVMRRLETHYRDLCDIEFTIERGKLWMLQTRVGKRTAGGGVPDRRAVGGREPDHHGRGAVPGVGFAAGVADVPAVRPVRGPDAADEGDGRLAGRRGGQGGLRLARPRRRGPNAASRWCWCAGRPTRTTWRA